MIEKADRFEASRYWRAEQESIDPKHMYYRLFQDSTVDFGMLGFISRIMEGERNSSKRVPGIGSLLQCTIPALRRRANILLAGCTSEFNPELIVRFYRELIYTLIETPVARDMLLRREVRDPFGGGTLAQEQTLWVVENEEIPFQRLRRYVYRKEYMERMAEFGAIIEPVQADLRKIINELSDADSDLSKDVSLEAKNAIDGNIDLLFSDGVLCCNDDQGIMDILKNYRAMLSKHRGDMYYRERFHGGWFTPDFIRRETEFGIVQRTMRWGLFCKLAKELEFGEHIKFRINTKADKGKDFTERVGLLRVKPKDANWSDL